MKLNIPLEAMNTSDHRKNESDERSAKIQVAKERKILTLTRILEPTFYEPFSFIYISGLENGLVSDGEDEDCQKMDLVQRLVKNINKIQPLPKFVVLCGGLTNNGKRKSCRVPLENALKTLDQSVKVLCIPGDSDFGHDLDTNMVDSYRNELGDDWYSFWSCGVAFLALNSIYFKQHGSKELESLSREQEDWIESEMIQCQFSKAKWTIVFQDRPWFTENPEEENNEKNIEKEIRIGMLSKFKEAGVSHVFCRGSADATLNATGYDLELTVTPGFSNEDPVARLVTITSDKIIQEIFSIS